MADALKDHLVDLFQELQERHIVEDNCPLDNCPTSTEEIDRLLTSESAVVQLGGARRCTMCDDCGRVYLWATSKKQLHRLLSEQMTEDWTADDLLRELGVYCYYESEL